MDKLKMQTVNKADENFKKLAAMFPNAVTETIDENGEIVRAIDKDVLMQEISCKVVDGNEERYQFTWPDKKKSVLLANAPINKTLRPVRDDETTPTGADSEGKPYCSSGSVDFDNTENLYIEGDNLEVLKLLQETYLGKIKMIYIDPPYNTGNDFVYEDDFAQSAEEYLENSGQYDEDGNRLVKNLDSNGRFHTDWLNMIYPRLKLAKDLLTDDGVIFISIDDNEIENLRKSCDEIFGEDNFVAQFIWRGGRRNLAKYVSTSHEYILCFAKNLEFCSSAGVSWNEQKKGLQVIYKKADQLVKECNFDYELASKKLRDWYRILPEDNESKANSHYSCIDERGVYFPSDISRGGGKGPKWEIRNPKTGNIVQTPSRGWSYAKIEDLQKDIAKGMIHFNGDGVPCKKRYLKENETQVLETVFYKDRRGSSKRLRALLDGDLFPFPKDEEVIAHYIKSFTDKNAIILDFFSGSATTAHAVMQLNAEDGGHRKFIMVQLPEVTDEKSEAYKAGYKNICEIGKERIRRAGNKILEEATQETVDIAKYGESYEVDETMNKHKNLDVGFRVLKCDSSNMKDVYYNPAEYEQSLFSRLEDNIKEDRTPEDLLFQVMLDLGILLSSKIQVRSEEVGMRSYSYFDVEDGYLIACFDKNIDEEVITAIAKQKPYYFVMRDSSMANDSVATNFEQIFATYSPDTVRKVL